MYNQKKEKKGEKKVENQKENKEKVPPRKTFFVFNMQLLDPSTGVVQVSTFAPIKVSYGIVLLFLSVKKCSSFRAVTKFIKVGIR